MSSSNINIPSGSPGPSSQQGPLFTPLPGTPPRGSANSIAGAQTAPLFDKRVVRDKRQIKISKAEVTRDTRSNFTIKERQNFIEKVTTGRTSKLAMIDYGKMMNSSTPQDDVFVINESIENFVVEAEKHFIRYDVIEFMKNFPWLQDQGTVPEADRFDQGHTVNLINCWDQIGRDKRITLRRIAETTTWVKTYLSAGFESYLDDLDWQHKYFLDCMDDNLLQSVLGELKNKFEEETHGGPLTLAVMIEKCINLSHDAIDALKTDVTTFTLANIPGENVDIAMPVEDFFTPSTVWRITVHCHMTR